MSDKPPVVFSKIEPLSLQTLLKEWVVIAMGIVSLGVFLFFVIANRFAEALNVFLSLTLGVFGSVIASKIYAYAEDRRIREQILRVHKLGDLDYINSWCAEMEEFDGRHVRNYRLDIKLMELNGSNGVLRCRLQYEMTKAFRHDECTFTFRRRLKGSTDETPKHAAEFLSKELDWESDERDFPEGCDLKDVFQIYDVRVNKDNVEVHKSVDTDQLVEYKADVSKYRSEEFVTLRFTAEVPLELESSIVVHCEFPTKEMSVNLDYEAIQDKIQAHAHRHFINETKVNATNYQGRIRCEYGGWAAPKNGVTVCWWKRTNV